MDEDQAIAKLKDGEIAGLEFLVETYQARAVQAAYLITHDRALAEDVVQSAFIRVFERFGDFDSTKPFSPWFLRIVVNSALKAAMRQARTVSLDISKQTEKTLLDSIPDSAAGPETEVEMADLSRVIWGKLRYLAPGQRAAIVLRYFAGFSEAETAEVLGIPHGTVKWRLFQARQILRALLQSLQSSLACLGIL